MGCQSDNECAYNEACINRECQNPCLYDRCGVNAECRASNHRSNCYCPELYRGNPRVQCERPQCTRDDECPFHLSCVQERCVDPCNCPPEALCSVFNHRPTCSCPPGFTGNPSIRCTKSEPCKTKWNERSQKKPN